MVRTSLQRPSSVAVCADKVREALGRRGCAFGVSEKNRRGIEKKI
jgi:hypothetical protein